MIFSLLYLVDRVASEAGGSLPAQFVYYGRNAVSSSILPENTPICETPAWI